MLSTYLEAIGMNLLERCDNGGEFTESDIRNLATQVLQCAGRARGLQRRIDSIDMAAARSRPSLHVIHGDRI